MKKEFEGWEPLKRPRHGLTAMERWKVVLEGIDQPYRVGQSTHEFLLQPYDRLMWEVVMPYIRTTLRYAVRNTFFCNILLADIICRTVLHITTWIIYRTIL